MQHSPLRRFEGSDLEVTEVKGQYSHYILERKCTLDILLRRPRRWSLLLTPHLLMTERRLTPLDVDYTLKRRDRHIDFGKCTGKDPIPTMWL